MNKQLHKFWAETKSIKTLRFQVNLYIDDIYSSNN